MFEELRAIVAENLGVEESELTMETSFREDLEADSLDLFEMVMAVEEKYDVEIPSEELENLNTIADVIKYIETHK
ncbi:acyl carrier protein [Mediterraneibacter butyricigenes]|uniref:Acyl carrier protein n=1 Tax=Mediterraneibacter butyricigenes TaxID=2316025 RepID=A0A391P2E0_9FIRM|nr:acyl carrier protein [Mediterraneibacter butyricigenes]RGO28475.1 acyl carrier protein [Dorea sp. OM02-2LB]GCA68204.1 acyl carrier protein [Mediterraneibacter butyricigenes]